MLVPCAAAALVPAQGLALVPTQGLALVPAEATCVLYKLSVVTCAVVPLQIICAVQSGVFECCATDHFYRQKLLPTETCAAVLVHCADKVLVPTVIEALPHVSTKAVKNIHKQSHKLHTLWTQEAAQEN